MPTFYVDTSALAKRYKQEAGTEFIDQLFDLLGKPKNKAATSFLTFLELLAMATRLRKGKQLFQEAHDRILARILNDFHAFFSVNPISTSILTHSVQIIKQHSLKAPDAQQLATALELEPILKQLGEQLVFIADDNDLHDAAKREGLETIHPRAQGAVRQLKQLTKND
jgi:predicted nucleic acid-binding protein